MFNVNTISFSPPFTLEKDCKTTTDFGNNKVPALKNGV